MLIRFYKNSAESIRVDKTDYLQEAIAMEGTLRESTSVTNPVITVEASPSSVPNSVVYLRVSHDAVDTLARNAQAKAKGETVQAREWLAREVSGDQKTVADSKNKEVMLFSATNKLNDVVKSNGVEAVRLVDSDLVVLLAEDIRRCNYVYIPSFNRYYYIDEVRSIRQNLWQISMHVDVLMSFKDDIYKQRLFMERGSGGSIPLDDDLLPLESIPEVTDEYFESDADELQFQPADDHDYPIYICIASSDYTPHEPPDFSYPSGIITTPSSQNVPSAWQFKSYALNISNFGILMKYLETHSADATGIASMMVYPFDISKDGASDSDILIFGNSTGAKGREVNLDATHGRVLCHFDFAQHQTDFRLRWLDYAPYSSYQLYLPYYGFIDLDPSVALGKTVYVYYALNPQSGDCQVFVTARSGTHLQLLFSGSAHVGVKIPPLATNQQQINDALTQEGIQLVLGDVASAVSIGLGVVSMNPVAIAGGVAGAVGTTAGFAVKASQKHVSAKATLASGELANYSEPRCFLRCTRSLPNVYGSTGYTDYVAEKGIPVKQVIKLAPHEGFSVFSDVHLQGFKEAYSPELANITNFLQTGVIL